MKIKDLTNKHNYITGVIKFNNIVNVTIMLDIKYQYRISYVDLEFKTLEECDKYLADNYLKIKYEAMEEILKEQNEKIDNQRKQLRNFNNIYSKLTNKKCDGCKNDYIDAFDECLSCSRHFSDNWESINQKSHPS